MKTTTLHRHLPTGILSTGLCLLTLCLASGSARAADLFWGGGTGAITDNNWYSDAALTTPATRANADVINMASGTLYIVNTATVYDTNIGLNSGDSAAVIVSGTWNNTAGELSIGNGAGSIGELTILTGGTVRANTFYVGNYGSGTFYLAEGAALTNSANAWFGRYADSTGLNSAIIDGHWYIGGYMRVAENGTSLLSIGQTGVVEVASYAYLGANLGSSGTAFVNGLWRIGDNFHVGQAGASGYLYIGQSGTVLVSQDSGAGLRVTYGTHQSTAHIEVDGYLNTGTGYIIVSHYGNSFMKIGATGTVVAGSYISIGQGDYYNNAAAPSDYLTAYSGTVFVEGYMSATTYLQVGNRLKGILDIATTGTVIAGSYLRMNAASTVTSSTATVAGYLKIGTYADVAYGANTSAHLNIQDSGSVVIGTYANIGNGANSNGIATVAGILQVNTNLTIGSSGKGVLDIQSGGTVFVGGTTIIGGAATGDGTILLNGGVLQTRQIARGAGITSFLFNGGTIRASANTDDFFANFPKIDLDGGSLTFDTQDFTITSTAALAGTSGAILDKIGIGILSLTADSSAYAGTLNVRAGILASGDSGARLGGTVNILSGAVLDIRKAALETTGNLTFADGSVWAYSLDTQNQLSANAIDIAGAGTLYLDLGSLSLSTLPIPSSYTLATYAAANGLSNFDNWTIIGGTVAYGAAIDTASVAGSIKLNVNSAGVDFLYWQGGDGNWDTTSTTWNLSGAPVTWAYGSLGIFATPAGTVNVSGLQTFDTLQFDVDGYILAGSGTLAANILTGSGIANFNVTAANATATINTAIVGTGLYKTGPGSLILGGPVSLNSQTTVTVDGGGLTLTSATITTNANNAITLTGGGTLSIGGLLTGGAPLYLGDTGVGTLEILSGGNVRITGGGSSRLGNAAGGNGTLIIRDGALWRSAAGISVGYNGSGEIYVAQGGSLILDTACLYIADQNGSTGSVTIDGYFQSGSNGADNIPGSYYQPIGYRGVGSFNIGVTGTARTGAFELGREAGAVGSSTVAGLWEIYGNNNTAIGKNDGSIGHLVIESTGTITVSTTSVGNYFALGLNAGSSGTATIRGYLDTGTRSNGTNDGNLIIGHSGTGYMLIGQTGTVYSSGTGSNTAALTMGRNAGSKGTLDIAGLLDLRSGFARIGIAGDADINILGTGTMFIGHHFQIGHGATGIVNIDGLLNVGTDLFIGNDGTGVLNLRSGGTVIVGGTTVIATAATSSGTLLLNGGVLETRQLARGAGSATILFNGGTIRAAANTANFFNNFPTLDLASGTLKLDTNNFTVTATNALDGSSDSALDKLGTGSLILTGNNADYTGTINVRAGSLDLGAGATLGGAVKVHSGASIRPTTAGGTVTNLAIDTGGSLDLRSASLTVGNINLADGAIWQYSFSGTHVLTAGTIDVAGSGTFYLDRDGMDIPLDPGAYTLAIFDNLTGIGDFTTWTIVGNDYSFIDLPYAAIDISSVPGTLKITIGLTDVEQLIWKGGDGNWDTTTTDWRKSAAPVLWADGAFAIFDAGSGNVTLADGLYTAFGLQFGDTGSDADYTIAGTGTITFSSAANIKTVTAASRATINTTLTAPALNKTGLGTLTLGGPATITGLAIIGAGTLDIAPAGTMTTAGLDIAPASTHTATVNISGLLTNTAALNIGNEGAGSLIISGTVNQSADAYVGRAGSGSGLLQVETNGLYQQTGGYLRIGGGAAGEAATSGTLIIETGGTATVTSNIHIGAYGSGTALIDGYLKSGASSYVGVYDGAQGAATVGEHGVFDTQSGLTIGYNSGASGTLIVAGLAKAGGALYVGQNAGATGNVLDIKATGTVTAGGAGYFGNAANSSGTVGVSGVLDITGISYLGNASGALGIITVENGGYYNSTGAIRLGAAASGSGILRIENGAVVRAGGGINVSYANGYGELHIATGGTLFVDVNTTYIGGNAGEANAASYGLMTVDGYLQTANNGTYYLPVGYSGTGVLNVGATGTIFAAQLDIGREATATGTVTLAGYYKSAAGASLVGSLGKGTFVVKDGGYFDNTGLTLTIGNGATGIGYMTVETGGTVTTAHLNVGNNGIGTLSIAPGGIISVSGTYRQNSLSTLAIAYDPNRTTPYITADTASLSGTLALSGYAGAYTPIAKSSELANNSILILTATSGNIGGNFTAVTGYGAGAPDYIVPGGNIDTDPATGFAHYRASYRLAWNDPMNAHGTFTLAAGETFEVDTPLINRLGDVSSGWDRRTLTKEGAGTLILSAQNTFTGTLAINAGTVRLGGPSTHAYGPIVNHGTLDFGPAPATGFRTVEVTSLAGNGSYNMTINPDTGAGDRLVVRGNATGSHHLNVSAAPGSTSAPSATLATISGKNEATFTGGLDYNGTNYAVLTAPDGHSVVLGANGDAGIHDAIRGIPGAQSLMWFASQDNLTRRIGELRIPGIAPDDSYSAWIRVRAEHSNLKSGTNMRPFDMDLFGFDLGADKTFVTLASARILIGLYAGYGHAKQDFEPRAGTGTAEGTSDQIALGIYAAWLHNAGWFANLTISGACYDNEFTSADQSGNRSRGKYNDNALGASLEFGKRIALDRAIGPGWFAEPTAQATHIRLMRDDYRTTGANHLAVAADSAVITRLRATLRAGRAWRQTEISARAGVAHETSSGGEIRIDAGRWRPNIDGTRVEAGVGVIWRPWDAGRLYFDYEFATGDAYQKPWSISLGYRHSF